MGEKWDHSGERQLARIQIRSNTLARKIDAWFQVLHLYIPTIASLREGDPTLSTDPQTTPLWLPSQIGWNAGFDHRLAAIELKLRNAQAYEALGNLRRNLQMRASLYDAKNRWLRGQNANTRAVKAVATIEKRLSVFAADYRAALNAITVLSPLLNVTVDPGLKPLKKEDIRSMTEAKELKKGDKTGETRGGLSWIWIHVDKSDANALAEDSESSTFGAVFQALTRETAIRVEWAKSRARAHRYIEEIKIVEAEMNRTLRFLATKAWQWTQKAELAATLNVGEGVRLGMSAYAMRQADVCKRLGKSFGERWSGVPLIIEKVEELVASPNAFSVDDDGDITMGSPDDKRAGEDGGEEGEGC